jgi:hypothetical protein
MDAPIPEKSRKKLQDLFADDTLTTNQWVMVVPKCKEAVECTPSNSDQYFVKKPGCKEEVKELRNAFEKVFAKTGHVITFWDDFALNVTHKLGLTYRELTNGKVEKYNEAQLQQLVLNPLMRELSKAACIIPNISDEAIKTDFLVQDEVDIVPDQRGQKPAVDALIQVSKADGTVIACVPIETKVDMNIRHYSQIACYINKLSTVEELTNFVLIGVIIDKRLFRLAFSVYCKGGTPLPIVHISPPIEWRSENSCTVDESSLLSLACTFLTGQIPRVKYMAGTCGGVSVDDLQEWGKLLQKTPHELGKPTNQAMYLQSLQKKQKDLEEKVAEQGKKIEEQEKEIKGLVDTLDIKPKRKRPKTTK